MAASSTIQTIRNTAVVIGVGAVLAVASLSTVFKAHASSTYAAGETTTSQGCGAIQDNYNDAQLAYTQAKSPEEQMDASNAIAYWQGRWNGVSCDQSVGALMVVPGTHWANIVPDVHVGNHAHIASTSSANGSSTSSTSTQGSKTHGQ